MKKIAIVHDWFTTFAGSERVVQQILRIFPDADLFSLIDFLPEKDRGFLGRRKIRTSFLQRIPFIEKHYKYYLALMPLAIEQMNLSGYDLILSSCHAVSKGLISGPEQLHISYIHTPIRYAWEMQNEYLSTVGLRGLKSMAARLILHYIRAWDLAAAQRPDMLIANSHFTATRIQKTYHRPASVIIHPPVDTDYYTPSNTCEDFFLTASRLVPYKHVDLIAQAFQSMPKKKLVIIGDGSEAPKIKALCGANIIWLGYQPNDILRDYLQRCKAFIFAAKDDFGILPLEAQACGTPVLAYGAGAALETIIPATAAQPTGIHYPEQTPASIRAAVLEFERTSERFTSAACRKNVERFSTERFCDEFERFVHASWDDFQSKKTIGTSSLFP